jgi:hypothetical protein
MLPNVDPKFLVAVTAVAGKVFIILADAQPPPGEDCGYWTAWAYDAIQQAASNSGKVGQRRAAKSKAAVEDSHVAA